MTASPALDRFTPWLLCLAAMVALAAYTWSTATTDLAAYTGPWLAHIRATGPISAFAEPFANYSPPYLYLLALVAPLADLVGPESTIKILSFAGHIALALAGQSLLRALGHPNPQRAALLLVAPSLLINPAVLVQCDALWATAIIMALAAAIESRMAAMFAWCGLAFAIKAQTAFIGPFFLAFALAHRVRFHDWLASPVAFVAALLPAWMAVWPATDLATIYLRQTGWSHALALNAPNVWSIVQVFAPASQTSALGMVASGFAVLAAGAYVLHFRDRLAHASNSDVLRAACFAALLLPALLPRMHERFFFLGEALTVLLWLLDPRWFRTALLIQLGSTLGLVGYLSGVPAFAVVGAIPMILATFMLSPFGVTTTTAQENSDDDTERRARAETPVTHSVHTSDRG
jgi:Gpi18-like mannosyltransferase